MAFSLNLSSVTTGGNIGPAILLLSLLLCNCVSGSILSSYDFDKLRNAVTDAFADDANMGHVIVARMVSFQERIRRERSSAFPHLAVEDDDDDAVTFEPQSDYYSLDGTNLDFGDFNRIAVDAIVQTSVYHRDTVITDLDTIKVDNGQFVWFTTRDMITTWFYPSMESTNSKVYTFGLEGIHRLELTAPNGQSTNSPVGQILTVITLSATNNNNDDQTISWHSWNKHDDTLYRNGSLRFAAQGLQDIRIFHNPVTDTRTLASLQTTKIQMYIVSIDESGHHLHLKSCANIPVTRATDLESFTINGHLYVAVTNGRTMTVWKHRAHEDDFVLHQRLVSTNVTDVQFFRIGYEHFVAVVDVGAAIIYQWKGAIFVRIQTLRLLGGGQAVKWHSIADEAEALLVLILKDRLLFFAWNKQSSQFVSSGQWQDHHWTFEAEVRAVSFSRFTAGHHVLLVATARTLLKFDVHLKRQRIAIEEKVKPDAFRAEADDIRNKLRRQEEFLIGAADLIESLKSKLIEVSHAPMITEQKELCPGFESKLAAVERSVHSTKASMMTGLSQHEYVGKIHLQGKHAFRSVDVLQTVDVRGDLKVDLLNGINMSHFFQDSIMMNDASYVSGSKTFTGRVVIKDSLQVTQSLNGQRPDDLVRLNRPQTVKGMKFLTPITVRSNVDVTGSVNNIELSEEAILLHSDNVQKITGEKVFVDDVTVKDMVLVSGKVNGIKLSELAAATVTSSGSQRITGHKKFKQMSVSSHVRADEVNGLDLSVLDSRIVRLDRPTLVTARKIFANDVVISDDGQLDVKLVNGLRIPQDLVRLSEKRIVLSAPKEFPRSVVTVSGDVTIKGSLDGIDLMDVMRTTGDQELCGNKTFVGPVHVTDMRRSRMGIPVPFAKTVVIHGNLNVAQVINSVPLNDIVLSNETSVVLSAPMTFLDNQNLNGLVQINDRINGLRFEEDFLHLSNTGQVITRPKVFLKPVIIKGDFEVGGKIDGVDLRQLAKNVVSLSSVHPQSISGRKSFVDGIAVDDTLVLPRLTSEDLFPNSLNVMKFSIEGYLEVDGLVNDVDFHELHANRMTLTTAQDIVAPVTIKGNVKTDKLQLFGKLNGHDVSSLWHNVLWKDGVRHHQTITGRKHFIGNVRVSQLFTSQGLNGIFIADVKRRTVPVVNGTVDLSGSRHLSFDGGIVVHGDLELRGTANGIDLATFATDSVRKHLNAHPAKGVKVFDMLHVHGNVWVSGTVNGLLLERDVLTSSTPQNISGRYTLCNDVTISSEVSLSSWTVRTLHVHGNLSVDSLVTSGDINGVNFQHLHGDAVVNGRGRQTMKGTKTFGGAVLFYKNLSVEHGVNDFNYAEHFRDIVVSDGATQIVTGKKEFASDVDSRTGVVQFRGPVILAGSLNGVDVGNVLRRCDEPFVVDRPVSIGGSLKIIGNVKTRGTFNGLNVSRDLVTTSGLVRLAGSNTVKTLTVDGDVKASSVNGWNLEDLRRNTLTVDGEHERVTGRKTVKGTVTVHPSPPVNDGFELGFQLSKKPQIHFHGNVTFLNGVLRVDDPLRDAEKSRWCDTVDSCRTLSALKRAATNKASNFLSMDLVYAVAVADISTVEVIRTATSVLFYVTGFSDCAKPMQVHIWNGVSKQFQITGIMNVRLVDKMKTVYGRDDEEPILCILHRNCQTGQRMMSVYVATGKRLKLKITWIQDYEDVVDFDVTLPSGSTDNVLMATLLKSSAIVLTNLFRSKRELLSVTSVPSSNGDRICWLSLPSDGPLLAISSQSTDRAVVYRMSSITKTLNHLSTLKVSILSAWSLQGSAAALLTLQHTKGMSEAVVYKLERGSDLSLIELERLEFQTTNIVTTVENTIDNAMQQHLLAVNFHHTISLYSKQGSSGTYVRLTTMLVEEVDRAMAVLVDGRVLLLTNTARGWNAYLADSYHRQDEGTDFNCAS